jgi:hypothetical protein
MKPWVQTLVLQKIKKKLKLFTQLIKNISLKYTNIQYKK